MHSQKKKNPIIISPANNVLLLITVIVSLGILLILHFIPVSANSLPADGILCGSGSAPNYGFEYDLMQPHWTVGWEEYTSEWAVAEVDTYLDELEYDNIAQTMILVLPQEEVGNRVNCAVHFLRYMRLGQPSGERKDNGFVFLIVVEPGDIDVHYGVGLGLPALTAHELTDLNRLAEETYKDTASLDEALITLVKEYDRVARANYAPLITMSPTSEPEELTIPTDPSAIAVLCCMTCLVMIAIILVLSFLMRIARGKVFNFPGGSGSSWNNHGPFTGGGSWNRPSGGGGWSGPSGGGGWNRPSGGGIKIPRSRGGSGSGRAGRGN